MEKCVCVCASVLCAFTVGVLCVLAYISVDSAGDGMHTEC